MIQFLILSCSDVLEEEVFDKVTAQNFFQNESDAIVGVIGVYDGLQDFNYWYRQFMLHEALPGSAAHFWPQHFNTLVYGDNVFAHLVMWEQSYKIISGANSIIDVLSKSSLDENKKEKLIAEVRFIRAMIYFNMARMYGNIPLVKSTPSNISDAIAPNSDSDESIFESSQFLKQVDREEIYDYIVEELKAAEVDLPIADFSNGVESGRAKKGSATALLAKVYLTQAGVQFNPDNGNLDQGDASKWTMAAEKAQELINDGIYKLEDNYDDVFKNSNDNNQETIFSIQYLESAVAGVTGEGGHTVSRMGIRGSNITPFASKQIFANKTFFDQWVAANGISDPRFETTFLTSYVDNNGNTINYGQGNFIRPHIWKFVSDDNNHEISAQNGNDYGDNPIYLRYADVLLIHSESLNESGSSPDGNTIYGINKVRERANQPLIELPISKEDLREAIWSERKWELSYEGHYYYDCQRTGRLLEEIELNWYDNSNGGTGRQIPFSAVTSKFYLMPIHFNARSANPSLKQNFGW